MNLHRKTAGILLACAIVCLGGVASAAPESDPIPRVDGTYDVELDLGVMVDDMLPLLIEAMEMEGDEDVEALRFLVDLLGVEVLDRLHVECRQKKDEAYGKVTLTLDTDEGGGLLGDLFAIPAGECRFGKYVSQDELIAVSVMHNLPAFLEIVLDLVARPEMREMMGDVPVNADGEIALGDFVPRRDLLPLLSGELDIVMLEGDEGASMMNWMQLPYLVALGTNDGPVLLETILGVASMMGGEEGAGVASMINEMPYEVVGDFELKVLPFGGCFALSEDFLVVGMSPDVLRDVLAGADGDLEVPDGQSWSYMDGKKYSAVMGDIMEMAAMMNPSGSQETAMMSGMYSELFAHLESETVLVTGSSDRLVIESDVQGSMMSGLYRMCLAMLEEMPRMIAAQMAAQMATQKEQEGVRGIVTTLDTALTQYGLEHDGLFPAHPTDLVAEGYLDEFPLDTEVPAGQYVEGAYTYLPLYDEEGLIAGYFLFVYGGGEGTGHDVYTAENLAAQNDFVVDSDGMSDGVAGFCYDGLALEQLADR